MWLCTGKSNSHSVEILWFYVTEINFMQNISADKHCSWSLETQTLGKRCLEGNSWVKNMWESVQEISVKTVTNWLVFFSIHSFWNTNTIRKSGHSKENILFSDLRHAINETPWKNISWAFCKSGQRNLFPDRTKLFSLFKCDILPCNARNE